MKETPILHATDLVKSYPSGENSLTVLDGVTFSVEAGTTCAIVGPSGSGKTTLLGLCAGLDRATSGEVRFMHHTLGDLDEEELAIIRNRHIGFVFQSFRLIPTLTALENVTVPVELQGMEWREAAGRAYELLRATGLAERTSHYPSQLSGGEQQRVAIARAFINRPELLLADEPTGNLDGETGRQITDLLFDLNKQSGTTLVIVTHDMELAGRCERIIRLRQGRVVSDEVAKASSEMTARILFDDPQNS